MRWWGDTGRVGFSPSCPWKEHVRGCGSQPSWRSSLPGVTWHGYYNDHTAHAVLPWFSIHILQWEISGKCSFVSGFPHDFNVVRITQDTCVCWAIIEEAFERFAKDQAGKGMSNETEVPSGLEESVWEDVVRRREKNEATGKTRLLIHPSCGFTVICWASLWTRYFPKSNRYVCQREPKRPYLSHLCSMYSYSYSFSEETPLTPGWTHCSLPYASVALYASVLALITFTVFWFSVHPSTGAELCRQELCHSHLWLLCI